MSVAIVALSIVCTTSFATITWLTYRTIRAAERDADARVGQVSTEVLLEREQWEHSQTTRALAEERARADALEEIIAGDLTNSGDPDLDRADVRSRVLRIAQRWRAVNAAGGQVPTVTDPAMPAEASAGASGADLRSPDGPAV